MGDDRFSFLHLDDDRALTLLDELDDKQGWDLPEDDIAVPLHHLPPYQDEDDETVLPSASHPSYPYGNPHARSGAQKTSTLFPSSSNTMSLATSLPVLSLRHLHSITTFGEPRDRGWSEMALDSLLTEEERIEVEEDLANGANGEPPQPTGQNAGDHPEDDEEIVGDDA